MFWLNAIVVLVNFDGQWKEVGTILKRKIVKVTNALRDHDIGECKLVMPPYEEIVRDGVAYACLTCNIVMLKVGEWSNDSKYYSYNDYI